ncbi:MAG TPA: hypothetical protein VK027_09990 [Chitinophagaceae bacterium]|nr:hypothetical protein [Chitinophagaceae bacterium]
MKVQLFTEIQKEFQFFPEQDLERYKNRFFNSELGKIYKAIPWNDLVRDFNIKEEPTVECLSLL